MKKYKEEKFLGGGSDGSVSLVTDLSTNSHLVLKRIPVAGFSTVDLERTRQEVRVLQQLDHANIVRFKDSFKDKTSICIVMEHCPNGSLEDEVFRRQTFQLKKIAERDGLEYVDKDEAARRAIAAARSADFEPSVSLQERQRQQASSSQTWTMKSPRRTTGGAPVITPTAIKDQDMAIGAFPPSLLIEWMTELLLAVKYIHSKKIIHRDIKSSNIFLSRKNHVKLGDFGVCKVCGGGGGGKGNNNNKVSSPTSAAAMNALSYIGTPHYMAPELCESESYDEKSDIWSLGVVFFELCTRQLPFNADNVLGLIEQITTQDAPRLPSHLDKRFQEILDHMLQRDPKNRLSAHQILSKWLSLPETHPSHPSHDAALARLMQEKSGPELNDLESTVSSAAASGASNAVPSKSNSKVSTAASSSTATSVENSPTSRKKGGSKEAVEGEEQDKIISRERSASSAAASDDVITSASPPRVPEEIKKAAAEMYRKPSSAEAQRQQQPPPPKGRKCRFSASDPASKANGYQSKIFTPVKDIVANRAAAAEVAALGASTASSSASDSSPIVNRKKSPNSAAVAEPTTPPPPQRGAFSNLMGQAAKANVIHRAPLSSPGSNATPSPKPKVQTKTPQQQQKSLKSTLSPMRSIIAAHGDDARVLTAAEHHASLERIRNAKSKLPMDQLRKEMKEKRAAALGNGAVASSDSSFSVTEADVYLPRSVASPFGSPTPNEFGAKAGPSPLLMVEKEDEVFVVRAGAPAPQHVVVPEEHYSSPVVAQHSANDLGPSAAVGREDSSSSSPTHQRQHKRIPPASLSAHVDPTAHHFENPLRSASPPARGGLSSTTSSTDTNSRSYAAPRPEPSVGSAAVQRSSGATAAAQQQPSSSRERGSPTTAAAPLPSMAERIVQMMRSNEPNLTLDDFDDVMLAVRKYKEERFGLI